MTGRGRTAAGALRSHWNVMFHPHRSGHEAPKALETIARRPDLELMAVDEKTGLRLYRHHPQP